MSPTHQDLSNDTTCCQIKKKKKNRRQKISWDCLFNPILQRGLELTPGGEGAASLAAAEEAGEVASLEAVQEAGLPHPRVTKELDLDLGDGRGGGDQLFNVLIGAAVNLQPMEQIPWGT